MPTDPSQRRLWQDSDTFTRSLRSEQEKEMGRGDREEEGQQDDKPWH